VAGGLETGFLFGRWQRAALGEGSAQGSDTFSPVRYQSGQAQQCRVEKLGREPRYIFLLPVPARFRAPRQESEVRLVALISTCCHQEEKGRRRGALRN